MMPEETINNFAADPEFSFIENSKFCCFAHIQYLYPILWGISMIFGVSSSLPLLG
jgi:hypothetical protein